ncbi:MAG: hypothetical protein K2N48_01505 [Muribaculaceae bacterium]|nr:hypothetical protein [Muribaculaceae bacterium]
MAIKNNYIESLPIPEFDKRLLYQFEDMCWEDINWWECKSERGKKEAREIMHRNRRRAEHSCGID